MKENFSKENRINIYLPFPLAFIFIDVICDTYIFSSFSHQPHIREIYLFFGLLLLQLFAAPIQSAFSDAYCRKKSLMVSLLCSLVTLVLLLLFEKRLIESICILIFILFIKGGFANTIPLSWAAIADTQEKNVRFSFAMSSAAFAIAYLVLVIANEYSTRINSILIMISFIAIVCFLAFNYFYDYRDKGELKREKIFEAKDKSALKTVFQIAYIETKFLLKSFISPYTREALLTFLLWEISLYSILLLYSDFNVKNFSIVVTTMLCGSISGTIILWFCNKIEDSIVIKFGYNISALSLLPFFVFWIFSEKVNFSLLAGCYFFHTMGNAFLTSTLFGILAKKTLPHEQGKIYGLIESTDTVAIIISFAFIMIYKFYNLPLVFIILISFLSVTVSWLPYAKLTKIRNKSI